MKRVAIEVTLNQGRADLLEFITALIPDDLVRPLTPSEHDASTAWSVQDHLVHLLGIERTFNAMIRRHLSGNANPVGLLNAPDGSRLPREQIMATVHARNEEWVRKHQGQDLSAIIALGQATRADTLTLLATLTDDQLAERLPGAPWSDGTIGGVLAVNTDHARSHQRMIQAALGQPHSA